MSKIPALALLAAAAMLTAGCAEKASSSEGESSLSAPPETTVTTAETTAPPEADSAAQNSEALGKAAAYLLNAGEMKLPASEKDEKNGMMFRFTAVTAESCNLTWDAYRITDSANDIGRAISVNGTLYGDQTCTYEPVPGESGSIAGYTLSGASVKRTESSGTKEYQICVSLTDPEPQLLLLASDGSGKTLAASPFDPEMTEYEWVALASANESGGEAVGGDGLFYTQGNVLMMDGSLFGSPKDTVESRIGYGIGTLQPFTEWSVPLQRSDIEYNGIRLSLMFRDGGLTSVYADYTLDDPYTFFNQVADDAVNAFGAADQAYSDENENYVESWYLPDQNITLYLYTYKVTAGETETVYFRQQYTVGKTDRFCGF
ncbi:MAG: hypothetical protein IKI58_06370 [Oscillospiraceae bacterium]|nr:hypothetical protein [Oscillospiraceae bacterium]